MCEEMIKTNTNSLATETTFDPKLPVEEVVTAIRTRRTTGQLIFHLSQGGVQRVELREKTKAKASQVAQIRNILGMK